MTNPEIEHILDGVEGQALAKTLHTWPFRDLRLLAAEVRRLQAEVQRLKHETRGRSSLTTLTTGTASGDP